MQGLIIKEIHLKKFFENKKTAEVRSTNTHKRGIIFLCCSKKHEIWGQAELYDVKIIFKKDYKKFEFLHQSPDFKGYPINYLWIMKNIIKYSKPLKYTHKPGCVIWINLDGFKKYVK